VVRSLPEPLARAISNRPDEREVAVAESRTHHSPGCTYSWEYEPEIQVQHVADIDGVRQALGASWQKVLRLTVGDLADAFVVPRGS